MESIKQFSLILAVWLAGEGIRSALGLVLPGNVLGMILLFLLLSFRVIRLEQVEEVSNFFLKNLTLFFIPAGVGILKYYQLLEGKTLAFLFTVIVTTVLVMLFTGYATQFCQKGVSHGKSDQ